MGINRPSNSFFFPKISKGDLLFADSGETSEEIGKCVAYINDYEAYAGGDIIILSPKNNNSMYLGYLMNHNIITKQKSQLGQGDAVVHIYSSNLSNIKVPLPPIPEQSAIANVLSDIDALIESLEKLIAKKRNIKQGVMQQLLTGKRRLPGFNGKWEKVNLGKVAEFMRGRALSKSDISEDGASKCIHYGQLFTEYKELIREVRSRTNKSDGYFYSKENDVLMPTSDVTPRGLATASCIKEDGVILGGGILIVRLRSNYDGLFFSYFVTLNKIFILKLVKGSTVFHIYANDLATLEINFPSFPEQIAIAEVLSDMDLEIEALEKKLDKYKKVKQGMMQELLTGKKRLI